MALTGMHIVSCGATSAQIYGPLITNVLWSQTFTSVTSGVTTLPVNSTGGPCVVRCYCSADSYVATGQAPATATTNATTATPTIGQQPAGRVFVPATTTYDIYANPGDYVAWINA